MRQLLFFTLLLIPISLRADKKLDLKDVERLVLEYNFGQKAAKAGIQVAHEKAAGKISEILPTVWFKAELIKEYYPQTTLFIKQPLPWVPQWKMEKEALKVAESVALRTKTLERKELLNTIQKLYFRIQFLEQQKDFTLQSFKIVEKFKRGSEQRFQRGFIPKAELSRSTLAFVDLEKTLQEVESELGSSRQQLFLNFGDTGQSKSLKTELKVGNSFLKLTEKEIRELLIKNSSESIAISKLQSEGANLTADAFQFKYFPEINFEARIPFNDETGSPISDRLAGRPIYLINLEWNLFNGGADLTEHRSLIALREKARYAHQENLVQYASEAEKSVGLLVQKRSAYLKLKEGVSLWKDIIAGSQQRFEKGLVSSKDLNDDISSYLDYATSYYKQTYELIVSISDFCMLVGREELFHKLMDI